MVAAPLRRCATDLTVRAHGDVAPWNIILVDSRHPVLVDWEEPSKYSELPWWFDTANVLITSGLASKEHIMMTSMSLDSDLQDTIASMVDAMRDEWVDDWTEFVAIRRVLRRGESPRELPKWRSWARRYANNAIEVR
jgi:thiamine kinase-like enzyme